MWQLCLLMLSVGVSSVHLSSLRKKTDASHDLNNVHRNAKNNELHQHTAHFSKLKRHTDKNTLKSIDRDLYSIQADLESHISNIAFRNAADDVENKPKREDCHESLDQIEGKLKNQLIPVLKVNSKDAPHSKGTAPLEQEIEKIISSIREISKQRAVDAKQKSATAGDLDIPANHIDVHNITNDKTAHYHNISNVQLNPNITVLHTNISLSNQGIVGSTINTKDNKTNNLIPQSPVNNAHNIPDTKNIVNIPAGIKRSITLDNHDNIQVDRVKRHDLKFTNINYKIPFAKNSHNPKAHTTENVKKDVEESVKPKPNVCDDVDRRKRQLPLLGDLVGDIPSKGLLPGVLSNVRNVVDRSLDVVIGSVSRDYQESDEEHQ